MPELPEVQTIVSDLQKILPGLKITGVETGWKKMFNNVSFENFKRDIVGEKILDVRRVGKNILIDLTGSKTILVPFCPRFFAQPSCLARNGRGYHFPFAV